MIVVLDDYHHLGNDTPVHAVLDRLIAYLPDVIHIVIVSREIPPLTLARLRSQDSLAPICFSPMKKHRSCSEKFLAWSSLRNSSANTASARTVGSQRCSWCARSRRGKSAPTVHPSIRWACCANRNATFSNILPKKFSRRNLPTCSNF